MRTSLVMRMRRLAVMGLAVVATAALFLTMHALKERYHARQVQKASRELEDRLRPKWLPYGIGLVVVVTAAVLFTMYAATERYHAGEVQKAAGVGEVTNSVSDTQKPGGAAEDVRREVTNYLRTRGLERARQATQP